MHLKATPKGSLRAFIFAVISCMLLTWGGAGAYAKHNVKTAPAGRLYTEWLQAYLLQHPNAPVAKAQEDMNIWGLGGAPGPLWTFATTQSSSVNGICIGCAVTNAALAVDNDTTTYSSLVTLVGVGGTVTQRLNFPGDYQAGDYIALDMEVPGQALGLTLLSGITVQTRNGSTLNPDATTLNGSLAGLTLLGLGGNKFRAFFPVASAFNGVQVTTGSALAALGSLRIYDAVAMVPVIVNPDSTVVVSGQSAAFNASLRLSGATFNWYTQPTGGSPVFTGATFNTPAVTQPANYYVEATTPDNLSSFVRIPVNVRVSGAPGPIWTYGDAQESPFTSGACVGCAVNNPALAVDGDSTTASGFALPLGILGAVGQRVIFPGVYYAGDSLVLILETPESQLSAQLLPGISVETYHNAILGPAVANNDAVTLNSPLARVDLLGASGGNTKFRVTLPLQDSADAVQVTLQPAVSLSSTEPLRLYEAVAMVPVTVTPSPDTVAYNQPATLTPSSRIDGATYNWYASPTGGAPLATGTFTTPPLTRNATYYVEGVDPDGKTSFKRTAVNVTVAGGTGPLWVYGADQQSPVTGGIACALCTVTSPDLAVDEDTTTASHLVLPLGVATYVGQYIRFPAEYQAGDSVVFFLGTENDPLATANLLGGLQVQTFNGGTSNGDATTLDNSLVKLDLLGSAGGINKFRVAFPATQSFDGARIDLTSTIGLSDGLYVYEAAAMMPVQVTRVNPASDTVEIGSPASFTASIPRIPAATFSWYETPEGGTPVYTGSNFTTPDLLDDKVYYVEAYSPTDGLHSLLRTAVPVYVTVTDNLGCGAADAQSNSTTGICVLCGVNNPLLAIDGDVNTASELRVTLGVLGGVYQSLGFPALSGAADSLRVGVGTSTGLLNLGLLNGLTFTLFNGNTQVAQLNDPSLLNLTLLNDTTRGEVSFAPGVAFDSVRIDFNAALAAVTSLNIYYAKFTAPNAGVQDSVARACPGGSVALTAATPSGASFRWYDSYTGGNLLFTGATFTPTNITSDTTFYVEAVSTGPNACGSNHRTPVQVMLGLPAVAVTPSTITIDRGTTATFNVTDPNANYTYSWFTDAAGGTAVHTGATFTTPALDTNAVYYVQADSSGCSSKRTPVYVTISTLPPAPDIIPDTAYVSTGQTATFRIASPDPSLTYRWYNVDSGGTVLATDTIYTIPAATANGKVYAEAVNASNQASRTRTEAVIQLVNAPGGVPCTYANAQESPVYTEPISICLLCGVTNPGNAIDGDTTTASHIRSNIGIGYIGQMLHFQQTGMAGDSLRLLLGLPGGLADAQLLGGVQLQLYNSGNPVGDPVILNNVLGLVNLQLLANDKFAATIPVGVAYDAVMVSLGGVLSALTTLDVYNAEQVMLPARPATGTDSLTVCLGSSAQLVATDTIGVTVSWYDTPIGGTALATGGTFTTSALSQATTTYYIGTSRNGCSNTTRVPVTVKAVSQPAAPQLTAAAINICVGQTAALSVQNPRTGITYTWYDAPTGGNAVDTGATLSIIPATTGVDTLHYYVEASVATCSSSSRTGGAVYVSNRCNGGNAGDTAAITVCNGSSITLTVDSVQTGATYQWFNAASNTLVFTGSSFATPALNADIMYRLEAAFSGGIRDTIRVYDISVEDTLATPALLAAEVFTTAGGTATFTVAGSLGGVTYTWYDVPTGGTALATGTSFTTPPLTGDSAKYYVAAGTGSCTSSARGVATLRLSGSSGVPCNMANATQSPVYTDPLSICLLCGVTGANNAVDGDTTTASQIRANVGIGYIGQVLDFQHAGLAGDSIRLILGLPTGLADAQLLGGVRIQMYSNGSAVGDPVFLNGGLGVLNLAALNGSKFAATFAAPVNYDAVYVSLGGVLTALSTLEIYSARQQLVPAKPNADSDSLTVCLGTSAHLVATDTTGVTVKWYGAPTGGLPLATGGTFNTPALNQASTTYYIETSRDGCANPLRVPVTVTALPQPTAPQLIAAGINACVGQPVTFSVQNPQPGITYTWYDAMMGGNQVDTGAVLNVTPPATGVDTVRYYVEAGAGSCTSSSRTMGTVYVFTKCNGSNTGDTATLTICNGSSLTLRTDSVQAGATYQWYNAANNSLVFTGPVFTTPALNADIMYRLEASFTGGAKDTIRVYEISVEDSLATPSLVTDTITTVPGGTATFMVANSLGGVTYTWYSTPAGGTPLATGTSFTTPALVGDSATYYVEASAGTCASSTRGKATVRASNGGGAPCYVANTSQSPVYTDPISICLLCGVTNADNAVDSDSTTASRVTAGVGIGYVGQVLNFQQPGMAGDSIRLVLSLPGGIADAQLLGGVRAQMYKSGSAVGDPIFLNDGLGVLKLQLLNGSRFAATFAAPVDYDAVYISIGGVLTAITSMDVFIAQQMIVPAKPATATDSLQACLGSSAQLVATDTAGVTVRWFATATGGTPLATGGTFTTPVLSQASTTYYIETSRNGCPNPLRVPVTVLAGNCGSNSGDSTTVTICRGTSTTLIVSNPVSGTTYSWYNTANNSQVATGTSFTTPVLNANTSYRLQATSGSTVDTVQVYNIIVTDPPVTPVLVNSTVVSCNSGPVQLAVQNPQSGVTYTWYDAPTGGSQVGTGATLTVTPPTGVDSVKYYVAAMAGSCTSPGRATATVQVISNLQPPAVVTAEQSTNLGGTVTFSIANPRGGITYRWYSTATGGTPIAIGTSFVTPPLAMDSVSYYVEASTGSCVSGTRTKVTVKANNNGNTGDTTYITLCTGTSLTLQAANPQTGATYRWYNTANNSLVFTGTTFTTPVLNSNITYLVEATLPGGTKDTNQVYIITVDNNTTPPVVVADTVKVCSGQDAVLIVQNPLPGFTYQWFDAPTGGTLVYTGPVFTVTGVTTSRNYYVQSVLNNKCISATRTRVSVQAGSTPAAPTVAAGNVTTCVGGTVTFSILNPDPAVTYRWYNQPANGSLLAIGTSYTTPGLASNTTYYVEAAYNAGCVSTVRTGVTATVVSTINPPLAGGTTICSGQTAVLMVTSPQAGIIYRWYSTPVGGTALFSGSSFITPVLTGNTTYYVESASGGGCVSASRTAASVTVNSTPAAPVVTSANVTVCPGQTATLSVQNPVTGITYRWYTAPTGGTPVTTGASFTTGTLNANQQYYVEAVNTNGCASTQRTAVSVTVGAPDANDITVTVPDPACPGSPATLTASAASVPGANFRWYSAATGGTQLYTGATFTTPPLDSAATYYVEVFTGSGCASSTRKAVTVGVLQQLSTPVVSISDSSATSVTFSWFPVSGAVRYEVTTDGTTFTPPSSGANGTTHTVTGLSPNQQVTLQVRAIGDNTCQNSALSAAVTGHSSNPAGDQVFVPNLFSPNGDGVNDMLMVYGNTIATIELHIYNYWGQEVFQSKDQRQGWDGTMSGRPQPSGVYVYILKARLQNGTTVNKKGNITLIR